METTSAIMVELDEQRRLSLDKVGRHSRYLVREERDGTLIFEPATVSGLTEFEARVLANEEIMAALRQTDRGQRRPRP
jgi:hypothetical protein